MESEESPPIQIREFERFVQESGAIARHRERPETLKAWLDLAEAYRITQALRECNGNRLPSLQIADHDHPLCWLVAMRAGRMKTMRIG